MNHFVRALRFSTRGSPLNLISRNFSLSSAASERHKCKVLVVGGGAGGCTEAAKFSAALGPNQVLLLEPSDKHYYQPMFTLIGGGMKPLKESWRPMRDCINSSTKWVQDSAVEFDPDKNTVVTSKCDEIEYEFLIIAVGLQLNFSKIPGLLDALKQPKSGVCSNYSPEYVERTFAAFNDFRSGNAIFTFPNSPVKCPGAPQKIMYIFEEYARKNRKRGQARIIYNTSLPVLFGVKHYAEALHNICEERGIQVNTRTNLVEVYPGKKQALFQNLDNPEKRQVLDYELLHVTPPMSTPDALSKCKQLTNSAGFVDVRPDTLQHVKYANVFAIGDCSGSPNSKTAASVAAQSQVVYKNLMAVMEGRVPSRVYDGYASCPLVTGYKTCILAEFDYSLTPLETFPVSQSKERLSMFLMKRDLMPPMYWYLLLNGLWNGPAMLRTALAPLRPLLNPDK